jgi:hypothetical protein
MYRIEGFSLKYYEQLVDMFYAFTIECNPTRYIGLRYRFHQTVMEWIDKEHDIVLVMKDDTVVGFSLCFLDNRGLTEPVYIAELCYVVPDHRNSKASYLLYNNVVKLAQENNITIETKTICLGDTDKMVEKHFPAIKTYTIHEIRRTDG